MKQYLLTGALILFCSIVFAQQFEEYRWTKIETNGVPEGRHENGFVEYNGKFYLFGGRGIHPVNVFDPADSSWIALKPTPMEIHHFQPVVFGDTIFIVGAMTGRYPREKALNHVWKYYPKSDTWEQGHLIPESRRRGGSGAVLYNNKIYVACGIICGHTSGTNNMFDAYDPKTGEWEVLTLAPHIRDHFSAVVVNDKLYCIGGRNGSFHYPDKFNAFFTETVSWVDVFDFELGKWYTMKAKLPIGTAAAGVVVVNNSIFYIGGEGSQKQAYNQTQCLDLETMQWSMLAPMTIGRHGSGAILYDSKIFIAAGSQHRGGGNMNSIEVFEEAHRWTSLFDGESLDGWSVKCIEADAGKKFWNVEDGAIHVDAMGKPNHNYVWLYSDESYDNFELRLQFKVDRVSKGNSGVQIRSRYDAQAEIEPGKNGWLDGPQIDIAPTKPWRNGLVYDETRHMKRWVYPSLPNWSIRQTDIPKQKVNFYWNNEETGWNDMTIICQGNHIKTMLNNIVVADYDASGVLDSEMHKRLDVDKSGHIALQLHKNDEIKMWYRNIEIRKR